jgi:hypothetical protein
MPIARRNAHRMRDVGADGAYRSRALSDRDGFGQDLVLAQFNKVSKRISRVSG